MDERNFNNFTIEIFDNKEAAEQAFMEAIKLGYKPEEISVLMSEDSRKKYYHLELKSDSDESPKGLAVGAVLGGAIGGTISALIALGTNLAFPGLGIIIAGPLAGAGSISGGLLGAMIGWGIPEESSKTYERGLKRGNIILGVKEIPGRTPLKNIWKIYSSKNN